MDILVLAGLGILLALFADGWLLRVAIRSGSVGTRIACGAGILASTAGGVVAGFFFLLGLVLWGCPPDVECL
jgi:hypothetical protein